MCTWNRSRFRCILVQIDVNGEGADPLFKWLKTSSGDSLDIPWNFNKFLVVCGKEVKRYSHQVILKTLITAITRRNAAGSVCACCPLS